MVGNLRRNEQKIINASRYNKPYHPWLISVFDLSSEEDRADDVNEKPSADYSINIGCDLQFGNE
jgi:hypothetical protein